MQFAVLLSLLVVLPFQAEAGSCVGKTVDVRVLNGKGLTGDGHFNHPDPYVVVKIGATTKKTTVIHENDNPSWLEDFKFPDVTSGAMIIEIWEADSGARGDDDHLGTCVVQMESEGRAVHKIVCKAKKSGHVQLEYKCY